MSQLPPGTDVPGFMLSPLRGWLWVTTSRQARRGPFASPSVSILNTPERPHPAATASDLPAARGGNFDNPYANGDAKTARSPQRESGDPVINSADCSRLRDPGTSRVGARPANSLIAYHRGRTDSTSSLNALVSVRTCRTKLLSSTLPSTDSISAVFSKVACRNLFW